MDDKITIDEWYSEYLTPVLKAIDAAGQEAEIDEERLEKFSDNFLLTGILTAVKDIDGDDVSETDCIQCVQRLLDAVDELRRKVAFG